MVAQRRRNLINSRRRVEDDGEDDVSVATEHNDDSQSEASIPSDIDEDADADASDLSDNETRASIGNDKSRVKAKGASKSGRRRRDGTQSNSDAAPAAKSNKLFAPGADTDVMMNGLKISEEVALDEGVDFEALDRTGQVVSTNPVIVSGRQETPAEKRRRDNEEYKKKREEDPAFIPNRGPFFMHDQRASQNGLRPFGRGRGRGRGTIGGPFAPAEMPGPVDEPMNSPWAHDLHETLLEQDLKPVPHHAAPDNRPPPTKTYPPRHIPSAPRPTPVHSFSTTREIAKALVRVSLPGMKAPITFADVPIKLYARLPNHRPPLRRDKPVRISLPDHPPRYIFPSTERSFIFIPRALRPNQQGFGRGRGRGFGSMGGFSSRRTSVYGGSVYTPSVAMSRRSSLAREFPRDGIVSPSGSVISRPPGASDGVTKPVVRLPPGNVPPSVPINTLQPFHNGSQVTPLMNIPQPSTYPLPQRPAYRENGSSSSLPMHQPRPQKAISVTGIESPANTYTAPQQQEQQPFHQQVPAHINGNAAPGDPSQYHPHSRQHSYPSQPSTGTPLSNIPERAIHAQPFQPFQQAGYPAPGFQPGYYYPPPPNGAHAQFPAGMPPGGMMPIFVPGGQPPAYVMPPLPAPVPMPASAAGQAQGALVAHEANGTVYYYDPASMYTTQAMEGYAPASYTVPGMGGMMTPSPDGYYYPQIPTGGTVYYAQPQ